MFKVFIISLALIFPTIAMADPIGLYICHYGYCRYVNYYPSFYGWRHWGNYGWTNSCFRAPWISDRNACSHN